MSMARLNSSQIGTLWRRPNCRAARKSHFSPLAPRGSSSSQAANTLPPQAAGTLLFQSRVTASSRCPFPGAGVATPAKGGTWGQRSSSLGVRAYEATQVSKASLVLFGCEGWGVVKTVGTAGMVGKRVGEGRRKEK